MKATIRFPFITDLIEMYSNTKKKNPIGVAISDNTLIETYFINIKIKLSVILFVFFCNNVF